MKRARFISVAILTFVALMIVGCASKPSPVGVWSVAGSDEWIEFDNKKVDDLFMPKHDGGWVRHRGQSTSSGKWLHVADDPTSFDMIFWVSGPMYERDGRLTLEKNTAQWTHTFGGYKVTVLEKSRIAPRKE